MGQSFLFSCLNQVQNYSPCVVLYNIILTNYVLSWIPFGTCDCITHLMIFTLEAFDDGIQNSKDVPSWFRPLKCRNLGNDSMIGVCDVIIDLHLVWLCWPLIMPIIVEKFNFYGKSNIYSTSSCIDFEIFRNILHRILIKTPWTTHLLMKLWSISMTVPKHATNVRETSCALQRNCKWLTHVDFYRWTYNFHPPI